MSLTEYRRKRQFDKTREPEPGKALPKGKRAIFVVQLHHARRRHYDFRLQIGDALKSWAVPKGPSYDPGVKRMAVEVEDHPVDYAGFEGEIPKGEYGGGHVATFDTGVWATEGDAEEQLAKGHIRFELFGKKLKGGWHLVRSGKPARQPQWLLFKDKDSFAGKLEADDLLGDVAKPPVAELKRSGSGKKNKAGKKVVARKRARRIDWSKRALELDGAKTSALKNEAFVPQLAKLGAAPPRGDEWLHELKWDGYRLVTTIVDGEVRIWSRNALEWTEKVPEITAAIEQLGLDSAALDGELIAGEGGQADFNILQATLAGERQDALTYVLFDLLHIDGVAIDRAPLLQRKALLADVLKRPVPHLALSSHIEGSGEQAFALASERAFEGIISKRADRPYHAGRGDDWRKTKRLDSEEFAVVGYTPGRGNRGGFGSLLLARPDAKHGWSYAGRIGSGFNNEQIRDLTRRIGESGGSKPTVHITPAVLSELGGRARWFKPKFVVEAFVRGRGSSGVLRQASLKAVRLDKDIDDLRDSDRAGKPEKKGRLRQTAKSRDPVSAKISSPAKVIYPDKGITKQEVANYYLAVMDHLLPEIKGRPLSIVRCPEGVEKPCFFQKHHTAGLKIVEFARLKEDAGNNANYLVVNDADALMELVQFNALEFHPWGSHAEAPDLADRVVFDLDPGPDVPFSEVKRAAVYVKNLLIQLKLKSFLRTTGGKGLHVVVPLNPGCEWDLVKRFAHGFADALARSDPSRFVSVSTLKLRPGRIFVDYLRNGRGATAVASYSLRARPGAPVAWPLAWTQLSKLKKGNAFTMKDVPARLKRRRVDPWKGIDKVKQDLSRWSFDE